MEGDVSQFHERCYVRSEFSWLACLCKLVPWLTDNRIIDQSDWSLMEGEIPKQFLGNR